MIIGLILLPVGLAIAAESLALGYYDRYGTVGTGFFPFWIGAGLAVCGPLMASIALISDLDGNDDGTEKPTREQIVAFVLMIAYAALIGIVGFVLASAAYFVVTLGFIARLRWQIVALSVVVSCVLLWVVIERWLAIPLPGGYLEGVKLL